LRRPDDCSLTAAQLARVRKEAERALREAGALGIFPTPVKQIMEVAKVEEVTGEVLSEGFLAKLRKSVGDAGGALKRAIGKLMGVFQAKSGLIFLDQTLIAVKKRFVRLHESAHGFLPWQRPIYGLVEDCDKALDADSAELFDREANVFASEVLFNLDTFRDLAADEKFTIWTPIDLADKFEASKYSAIRQYVSKNDRVCAVVVLNMPKLVEGDGFRATLRRPIQSPEFSKIFGNYPWKDYYTPDDDIGAMVPLGKKRSAGKRQMVLVDKNGQRHECICESFTNTYQVFVLIHSVKTLGSTHSIILP
jgi:hypothetical protein